MGLRVISPIEFVSAELDGVLAANQTHIVGKLITPHDGEAGKENLRSNVGEPGHIEPDLAGSIWVHIEVGIIPLDTSFIQCPRTELVEPRAEQGVVESFDSAAAGEPRQ